MAKRRLKKKVKAILIVFPIVVIALICFYNFVHIYKDATCTSAKTCLICHKTVGDALGHDYTEVTCIDDSICTRCGDLKEKALGHDYLRVTDTLDICLRCNEEKGQLTDFEDDGTYLLMCLNLDKILYAHNEDEEHACASITKLVTTSLALEYLDINDYIEVGDEIYLLHENSSKAWLVYGDTLSVKQMIEACLIPSGNDAAFVLARNVIRKINPSLDTKEAIEYFVELMNEYCLELDCENTMFYSPDGYDYDLQHTTCNDLVKIAQNALNFDLIKDTVCLEEVYEESYNGYYYVWQNTNCFLHSESIYYNEHVNGLKTGTTPLANNCIIVTYEIKGADYLLIVLNEDSHESRYELATALIGLTE